jgi:hypothetical protein
MPIPVPVHALSRLFECGGGNRDQQHPFQRLLARGSFLLPPRARPTYVGRARGGKRKLPLSKMHLGRTTSVSMSGKHLARTARLAWKDSGLLQRIADRFLVLLNAPVLSGSHQKVRLRRLSGLKERERSCPLISDIDPQAPGSGTPIVCIWHIQTSVSRFSRLHHWEFVLHRAQECAQMVPEPDIRGLHVSEDAGPPYFIMALEIWLSLTFRESKGVRREGTESGPLLKPVEANGSVANARAFTKSEGEPNF